MTDAHLMDAECVHGVAWHECKTCIADSFGFPGEAELEADLIAHLPGHLRSLACPAGQPWTGSTPEADHGHTACYFLHLAANEIETLRGKLK